MNATASVVGALLIACLSACTRSDSRYYGTTEPKHGPDEVWVNLGAEPEYIDPGKCADSPGGFVIMNLFAGLTQPDPATLEAKPDIAERWTVSEGGRRYTFHLRKTQWSDGTPLTAHDFVYSWLRVLDPATASKYSSFLFPLRYGEMFQSRALLVRGVPAGQQDALRQSIEAIVPVDRMRSAPELGAVFVLIGGDDEAKAAARAQVIAKLNGKPLLGATLQVSIANASVVGVHAVDDHTLVADLEDPLPYFLDLVKFYTAMPVPRHVLARLQKAGINTDLWTRADHIVTNGAYTLKEWKFRQRVLLQKNPRYWDAAHVKMKRVRLSMVESNNTTLNLYEAGELDSIGHSSLPSEFLDHLSRYRDFRQGPYLGNYFYWVNSKAPPMDDPRVRKALSLAIDRKSLVEHVSRGGQIPFADLVPEGVGGYHGPASPIFDPVRARALLAQAGYGPNRPLPKVTLTYNTSEGHKQMAEAVQQMWKTHLGIAAEIENQEWKVYLKSLDTGAFQIARMGWIGDYPDPFTFLELLSSSNGNNRSGFSSPQYDELLRRANATQEKQARFALLREAESLAMEQTPVIPIYVYTRSELTKPYVKGHTLNYENRFLFKYWSIDERWYHGIPSDEARPR